MNKIKKIFAAVLAVIILAASLTAVPVEAAVPTVTFATHPYKFNMGWRSGYNPVTYGASFRCINTSGGTTYEYYLKGLNNTEIRMYCLDHRLASPPNADIMCQGSVASYYGANAAKYLNGIAAFDQFGYRNSVVYYLPNQRHRESLTQLALWYASQEIVRGGATSVSFNNLLYKMDVKTMLQAYGLGLVGLQGTWMSYKGLTWADVTGLTEDQLYELIADDYVTHLDAYIQNPTCVTSYGDTVYTSIWTGLSSQQPMMVIGNNTFYPENYSGIVYAYKSDELGNMVQGVTFGIYNDAACTSRITTMTTNADGYAKASVSLTDDMRTTKTVYVKEISAPANYRMDSTVYTCVVKSYNKDIAEISSTSRWTRVGGANATIVNTATGYLTLTKEDNAGNALGAGVIFGLFTDAECTNKIDEFTTDENGVAKSAVHDRGTYYLKELSVPDSFHVVISSDVTEISLGIGENTLTVENDLMGQISVIKKDDAGTTLGAGFSFGIYTDANCTNLVETITTDTTGTAEIYSTNNT